MKKWKLLLFYIKTIKKHKQDILNYFILEKQQSSYKIKDMRLDRIYRLYTVLNFLPDSTATDKAYGYQYIDNEVRKFLKELTLQFKKYGLDELIGLTRADKLSIEGTTSIWVVVEFKYLKTFKIARNLLLFILGLITGGLLFYFI